MTAAALGPWASEATTRDQALLHERMPGGARLLAVPAGERLAFTCAERARRELAAKRPRALVAASALRSGWAITTAKPRSRSSAVASWKSAAMPSNGVSTSSQRLPAGPWAIGLQLGPGAALPTSSWPSSPPQCTVERDARVRQRRAQLAHPLRAARAASVTKSARTCGVATTVVVPVGHGGPRELEALGHVLGPVVHAGEQVEVKIGCIHRRLSFGPERAGVSDRSVTRALRAGE